MSDPTRETALDLLGAVLDQHRTLEAALESLPAGVEARDRAAAHRLAAAVLRRAGTLDAVLEPYLRRAPPDPVRQILRLGAAALLLLDAPAHAAVGTAVDLARARGFDGFAGLVNAVLRKVAGGGKAALEGLDAPRLDTPPWLWASWGADARAIATAHQGEAPIDLTLAPGAPVPPGAVLLPNGSARLPPGTRVTDLPGYAEGQFWVQDAAAALPARLLGVSAGMRVADLCAAPGGKTAQLAATGAQVVAVERDRARLARLRQNMERLHLPASLLAADVLGWEPQGGLFDAVLLDAPCSATGTIRRHPDIPHRRQSGEIAALATQQTALLAAAAALLRPGGRLVYAVCSLQPEEGPARAAAIMAGSGVATLPLEPDPVLPEELPGLEGAITPEGWVRTHPGMWAEQGGLDGFFIARFRHS